MKLAIIVPAAIAILAATGAHAQTGSADDGHRLVQRDCAMCHDVERTGASANPAAPPFRNPDDDASAIQQAKNVRAPFEFEADYVALCNHDDTVIWHRTEAGCQRRGHP